MKRQIVYTILGGLLLFLVVVLLWFWFFARTSTPATNTGSLGTSQDKGNTGTGSGNSNNGQAPIGSNTGAGSGGDISTGNNTQTPIGSADNPNIYDTDPLNPSYILPIGSSGVVWLDGSISGGNSKSFNPTPINALNSVDVSGTGTFNTGNGSGGANNGAVVACTAGLLVGLANTAITSILGSLLAVTVNAPGQNAADADRIMKDFLGCIARTIARAALQKITSNIVDWVNSGFNGKPAFVQDYQKYFLDAADKAAGQFLQGSDFALLCSPFQQQVKIAVAQSYAHRSGGVGAGASANSCTLTQAVGNIDKFLAGDFSQGGWSGLLAYTTNPVNNAYGAYAQESIALDNVQAQAVINATRMVSPGGALAQTDASGKINIPAGDVEFLSTLPYSSSIDSLNMAKSFDEIISALITQLVDRTIYNGLSNLSGANGYASNFSSAQNQQALAAAQTLLTNLQNAVQLTQQYGLAEQGSISDIQNAQSQLVTLENCWSTIASSTTLSAGQTAQAGDNAASTMTKIQSLEARVFLYNNRITKANTSVVLIQQLQTSALAATTLKQVQAVSAQFSAAQTAGTMVTQADVTSAQQDRTTLQSEMTALNQITAAGLNQCYAFGQ